MAESSNGSIRVGVAADRADVSRVTCFRTCRSSYSCNVVVRTLREVFIFHRAADGTYMVTFAGSRAVRLRVVDPCAPCVSGACRLRIRDVDVAVVIYDGHREGVAVCVYRVVCRRVYAKDADRIIGRGRAARYREGQSYDAAVVRCVRFGAVLDNVCRAVVAGLRDACIIEVAFHSRVGNGVHEERAAHLSLVCRIYVRALRYGVESQSLRIVDHEVLSPDTRVAREFYVNVDRRALSRVDGVDRHLRIRKRRNDLVNCLAADRTGLALESGNAYSCGSDHYPVAEGVRLCEHVRADRTRLGVVRCVALAPCGRIRMSHGLGMRSAARADSRMSRGARVCPVAPVVGVGVDGDDRGGLCYLCGSCRVAEVLLASRAVPVFYITCSYASCGGCSRMREVSVVVRGIERSGNGLCLVTY